MGMGMGMGIGIGMGMGMGERMIVNAIKACELKL